MMKNFCFKSFLAAAHVLLTFLTVVQQVKHFILIFVIIIIFISYFHNFQGAYHNTTHYIKNLENQFLPCEIQFFH